MIFSHGTACACRAGSGQLPEGGPHSGHPLPRSTPSRSLEPAVTAPAPSRIITSPDGASCLPEGARFHRWIRHPRIDPVIHQGQADGGWRASIVLGAGLKSTTPPPAPGSGRPGPDRSTTGATLPSDSLLLEGRMTP